MNLNQVQIQKQQNSAILENSPIDLLYNQSPLGDIKKRDNQYLEQLSKMKQRGRIELIIGPMFAGKSTELLRRVKRLEISGKKCINIKFIADQRYSKSCISTHDQQQIKALSCQNLLSIDEKEWMDHDVLGVDEGQFFDDLVEFSERAANLGKIVIISALNSDFRKQSWPSIAGLMPLAEKVKNLSAICKVCGSNAAFTFKYDASMQMCNSPGENIEIGGADMYMPLCRECFNEKTRQQQESKFLSVPAAQAVASNFNFGSSSTLAESRENNHSNSLRIEGSNSTASVQDAVTSSSSETQKNTQGSTVPMFDMKQARSVLESGGDSAEANRFGPQTPHEVHDFYDENTYDGIQLRVSKKQVFSKAQDSQEVLKDKKNTQYSDSKVMSFTGSEQEMTEETLRKKNQLSSKQEEQQEIGKVMFSLKENSLQTDQCL